VKTGEWQGGDSSPTEGDVARMRPSRRSAEKLPVRTLLAERLQELVDFFHARPRASAAKIASATISGRTSNGSLWIVSFSAVALTAIV